MFENFEALRSILFKKVHGECNTQTNDTVFITLAFTVRSNQAVVVTNTKKKHRMSVVASQLNQPRSFAC